MNLDQLRNMDIKAAAPASYKLVDAMCRNIEDGRLKLPAAALFVWGFCQATGLSPAHLMEAVDAAARDAKRRQEPAIEAMLRYYREEILK